MSEQATANTPAATEGLLNQPSERPAEGQPSEQPAEGQPSEQPAEGQQQSQVPESYDFKMPEGVEADAQAVEDFSAIAKELGLSQEQAQRVAQVGAEMALRQQEAHVKQVREWTDEVKNDKEVGGDKLNDSIALARAAATKFGNDELIQVLDQTGLSNHPAVFKFFVKLGQATKDDSFVGGRQAHSPRDIANILYPSMQQKG